MALQNRWRWQSNNWLWASAIVLLATVGLGCEATDTKLPPTVPDPTTLKTAKGAIARYQSAVAHLPGVFDSVLTMTGVLTDELASLPAPVGIGQSPYTEIDSRRSLAGFEGTYNGLHRLRGQTREARGFVAAYAPDSSPALAGHLYALEAYADVFLADVFCSGIPLSTVDFDGDYTLASGSTTTEVYEHAVALFDSALAVVSDSVRVQHFAAVGKGRALLALGRYAEAAAAVAGVPDNYQYQVMVVPSRTRLALLQLFASQPFVGQSAGDGYQFFPAIPNMSNSEGTNGLNYRTSGDPRTPATARPGTDPNGNTYWFPSKYPVSGTVTFTVASGIEARLIEAEAALQAGDAATWLAKLNGLRNAAGMVPDTLVDTLGITGCSPTQMCGADGVSGGTLVISGGDIPMDSSKIMPLSGTVALDMLRTHCRAWSSYPPCFLSPNSETYTWVRRYVRLPALTDPGTDPARIDLQFRERAFWLYLTGHRQGDLRRLVREYLRDPTTVYPTGAYSGGAGSYGTEVVAPVPASEQVLNSRYTGCFHLNP